MMPARNRWRLFATLLGGAAGFAYYHYIGCNTGSCPITGNPWISSAYGGLIGWLAVSPAAPAHRERKDS